MEEWISLTEYMKRFHIGYKEVKKMIDNNELEYKQSDGGHFRIKIGGNTVSRELYESEKEKRMAFCCGNFSACFLSGFLQGLAGRSGFRVLSACFESDRGKGSVFVPAAGGADSSGDSGSILLELL